MKKQWLQIFFLVLPSLLIAQDTTKTLIRAGKLFNSETGLFQTDMAVLVTGRTIDTVQSFKGLSGSQLTAYKLIDLSKYAVLPGLTDAHTHLLYKETLYPDNKSDGLDMLKTLALEGDAYRAIYGAVRAKAYLEAGITSVQDLGNSGQYADMALRKAIEEKLVPGPRMRCAGRGLSSEGGQLPGLVYKHREIINDEYRIVKGVDDAVQAVRENITQGADVIKIYSNNSPNVTALSVEEMQAIVREAHRYGIRVTAHATDNQAVYNAIVSGVDGIEHGYWVDDSTIELMAKKGVVWVPTNGDSVTNTRYLQISEPTSASIGSAVAYWRQRDSHHLVYAIQKGVTIAAGSDDYVDLKMPLAEPSVRTLIGYFECGMTIPQVLKTATINAARQLNWSKRMGILKPHFWADIIATDINLDTNINALLEVHFVMKNGTVYVNN